MPRKYGEEPRVKQEGSTYIILRGTEVEGRIVQIPGGEFMWTNALGLTGVANTLHQAFAQLGFELQK